AQAAIAAGGVRVEGVVVEKAAVLVAAGARLDDAPAHPWVSRGGVKLAHALDAFAVDPAGRVCLDVGASTGGFTEVLLARGAAQVIAVDVGEGQLDARIASDPRVRSLQKTDARDLTAAMLGQAPSLIVADVSFIGLAKALPAPLSLAARACDLVALVKPQFESGPRDKPVLAEAEARAIAASVVASLDGLCGFRVKSVIDSPIRGGEGALEFLLHARRP
ncbi:MAG: TlyA family RNA methyltransferase, partial [Hyphomonadaceae bacterium]|nr:TlyA family RNA methyltransferase [Hyphomonadaceae bacterium]